MYVYTHSQFQMESCQFYNSQLASTNCMDVSPIKACLGIALAPSTKHQKHAIEEWEAARSAITTMET